MAAEICNIPYLIQSKLAGIKLYGWLPIASRRSNLAQVTRVDGLLQFGDGFAFSQNGVTTLIYSENGTLLAGQVPVNLTGVDEPFENGLTRPVVLARVPARAPWEVFEKLPLGASGPRLAALARRWYQQYGAVPAALGLGWVEFTLPDVPPKTTLAGRDRLALALAGRRPVRLTL